MLQNKWGMYTASSPTLVQHSNQEIQVAARLLHFGFTAKTAQPFGISK